MGEGPEGEKGSGKGRLVGMRGRDQGQSRSRGGSLARGTQLYVTVPVRSLHPRSRRRLLLRAPHPVAVHELTRTAAPSPRAASSATAVPPRHKTPSPPPRVHCSTSPSARPGAAPCAAVPLAACTPAVAY